MADISMCSNDNCKDKNSCYRFTAPRNPWRQSYVAIVGVFDKNTCIYYTEDTRNEEERAAAKRWQEQAEAEYKESLKKRYNEKTI